MATRPKPPIPAEPRPALGVAAPTGRTAPTKPPVRVDPVVDAAMERVRPAPGYAVARLVLARERHEQMGLPAQTEALLDSAMLRILALHPGDGMLASEFPASSVVFASLDGLAPLLGTYVYLLPLERVQGTYPVDGGESAEPVGFHD